MLRVVRTSKEFYDLTLANICRCRSPRGIEAFREVLMRRTVAALLSFSFLSSAHAATVDVHLTIFGSPGDWLYDFSVTNNTQPAIAGLVHLSNIVGFGVDLPGGSIVGSPADWVASSTGQTEWCAVSCYRIGAYFSNLPSGATVEHFLIRRNSLNPESSVSWFASYAFDDTPPAQGGVQYLPSISGVVLDDLVLDAPALHQTPLPAALSLFASGIGLMGIFTFRMRRKQGQK